MNPMQILTQMMSGGNPQQMLQQALQQNPQLGALLNQQKQSGLSMEQFVRQMAQQKGVNIEPMINMLRQKGIK